MSVWSRLLVTFFTNVIVVVDEVPAGQNMSCKCWMLRINAGVQNCDSDRTIWSGASVYLMCQRQVNLFWRPLGHVCSVVATNTPGKAHAPGKATTDRGFRDVVRFDEDDARIMRQGVYTIFYGSVVGHPQSEDRSGSELIDGSRIEGILLSNRRQIAGASQFDNDLTGDKLFTTVARVGETILTHV